MHVKRKHGVREARSEPERIGEPERWVESGGQASCQPTAQIRRDKSERDGMNDAREMHRLSRRLAWRPLSETLACLG